MSLLLEALKPADSNSAAIIESEEEALDARATLELLAPKQTLQGTLSLVSTADVATPLPSTPAPELVDEIAADALSSAQAVSGNAARVPDFASSAPAMATTANILPANAPPASSAPANARATAAGPANARATVAAPAALPLIRTYGLPLAALIVIAGIAIAGKSLWSSNAVIYPAAGESQQIPPATDHAAAPTTGAVQVSSARPADQFAYAGNAPEIDLREPGTPAPRSPTTPPASAILPSTAAPRAATVHLSASTLSVTRSEGLSSIDRHVQAGYSALASGRLANAETEYFTALELDPNNVDALMGVATAASREGRTKIAADAYAKVLRLEPGNPDATAALTMLGDGGSAGESNESRLKILIAGDDGGHPALHAALGGVYSADARWTEAAQEYFTALGKDPGNPDLAFNVAASLDQNRNVAMALNYYRQALAFARQRPTQIDLRAIQQRISQLQARLEVHAPNAPETP